jgi:hypothetical protein
MALNNFAYYNTQTGLIENVILVENNVVPTLIFPEGYAIVDLPDAGISGKWSMCGAGWSYFNGQFLEPLCPTAGCVLTDNISSTDTVLPVNSTELFYSSGYLFIENETMSYESIGPNAINVVERGLNGSTAVEHPAGSLVTSGQKMQKDKFPSIGLQTS